MSSIELSIMEEAERHSRRLGRLAIVASNASWKHDEAIRAVRHAYGAAKRDALDRLAALIASYDATPPAGSVSASQSKVRKRVSASVVLAGTVASLLMFGVTIPAGSVQTATASPAPLAPIMSPADAERMRMLLADAVAVLRSIVGAPNACPAHVETIHPVWRR